MKTIAHRINQLKELVKVPLDCGIEIDLRGSHDGRIYCQHEPFENGVDFEDLLLVYKLRNMTGTIILDIKNERIEEECLRLLREYQVDDYFFLDCSFPMIHKLTESGEKKVAIRFSEYEGIDTLRAMRGKCDWVWVDTFTKNPLTKEIASEIHRLGYKICFVSPELQGQLNKKEEYMKEIEDLDVEAVCTDI